MTFISSSPERVGGDRGKEAPGRGSSRQRPPAASGGRLLEYACPARYRSGGPLPIRNPKTTLDAIPWNQRLLAPGVTASDVHRAIDAVWRIESAKLIAGLARIVRDVGLAEDLAQDALLAALERWPRSGIPDNPGAWLMATAKHRAIDSLRRSSRLERKHEELGRELGSRLESPEAELAAAIDDPIGDDLLRLVFTTCHPVLSTEARAALTLRLLGGLTTEEIARAFLVPAPTIAQRIVRAKRTLADSQVQFEVPRGDELTGRLSSVLEVIYLIFNEGYSATAGDDWVRPALCEDALRLGRILAELAPAEPEVHGLVALMEIQASRLRVRVGPSGEPVLLLDQNRARWDQLLIHRGLTALERAEALGGVPGPYVIQAAIAACHARARAADETDWARIADLYDLLARLAPSPIVELNRAVAIAMAFGPAAGLDLVDSLASEPSLQSYHLLPAVRGDFLAKLGRCVEARAELERAASLTRNARERDLLLGKAAACAEQDTRGIS
ncbi:MAG TPA: RNA polymerase sigma factor [Gemmatimonadaceae bacterium]|nr:RNA polymerase sigma factor [Gemmatimonadaceae bacterium]